MWRTSRWASHASTIICAFAGPMPGTSVRRSGERSMMSRVSHAEVGDEQLRHLLADAADGAAAQVADQALGGGRLVQAVADDAELLAVLAVGLPLAPELERLAGHGVGEGADDGDLVAVEGLQASDGVAVFVVVPDDRLQVALEGQQVVARLLDDGFGKQAPGLRRIAFHGILSDGCRKNNRTHGTGANRCAAHPSIHPLFDTFPFSEKESCRGKRKEVAKSRERD